MVLCLFFVAPPLCPLPILCISAEVARAWYLLFKTMLLLQSSSTPPSLPPCVFPLPLSVTVYWCKTPVVLKPSYMQATLHPLYSQVLTFTERQQVQGGPVPPTTGQEGNGGDAHVWQTGPSIDRMRKPHSPHHDIGGPP